MTTEEAFDLYHQAVFSFVYRLTRRADLAEDITQDCFLAYIGAPERFDMARGASLKTYLIGTARNLAFKWIRDHPYEWQVHKLEATTPPESGTTSEISAAVQSAIADLPPLQQEALILFEYEGVHARRDCSNGRRRCRDHQIAPAPRPRTPQARTGTI